MVRLPNLKMFLVQCPVTTWKVVSMKPKSVMAQLAIAWNMSLFCKCPGKEKQSSLYVLIFSGPHLKPTVRLISIRVHPWILSLFCHCWRSTPPSPCFHWIHLGGRCTRPGAAPLTTWGREPLLTFHSSLPHDSNEPPWQWNPLDCEKLALSPLYPLFSPYTAAQLKVELRVKCCFIALIMLGLILFDLTRPVTNISYLKDKMLFISLRYIVNLYLPYKNKNKCDHFLKINFFANMANTIMQLRYHPSIMLACG